MGRTVRPTKTTTEKSPEVGRNVKVPKPGLPKGAKNTIYGGKKG